MAYILSIAMQYAVVFFIVGFVLLIFACIITWWYLGRKARNKWLLLLLFVPFGFIVLLLLENKAIGYGGDFEGEPVTNRWPDTGPYSAPNDRQLKELDYTPNKNVLDIVDSRDTKDVGVTKDVSDIGDVGVAGAASEEAPAPEKVTERAVSTERLKLPILLDDAGAVIRCFYHPGADAVNLCSRCKQYVCNECNYVTGTHPICRNCWDKRGDVPIIAPQAQKQESPALVKSEKQKSVKPPKPEKQKTVALAEKPEAKKSEWPSEFMAVYEQASPIINVVTRKSTDGMPASPLDLMEGLKLRPMLERSKKLSKPKDKELREARSEFEQVLSSCIKIADAAADFVSGGGQALLGGPDFARIIQGIATADGLMQKLSNRLASFSHPQE
ncbi:MAG: B-box zinc finger protein [Dehalococcoidia bacterium]